MNRLGIIILSILISEKVFCNASAMSAYEIAEKADSVYRADSIYRRLVELKKSGYVRSGYKDGKANTYYITEKGQKVLEDARKAG